MTNNYYKTKKDFEKKHAKKIKIFLKKKKTDAKIRPENNIRISLKKKNLKKRQYHR